jgi:DNA polymerase-1
VYRRLNAEKRQAQMLLSVHDELVFEAPTTEIKALTSLVREEMSGAMTLSVPLRVDVGMGSNWLDIDKQ